MIRCYPFRVPVERNRDVLPNVRPTARNPATIVLVCAVLLWSLGLRLWRLDGTLFRVDEAESTINALTILERGYPASQYLGLPLFENTLTEPWPDSVEYEFRDSSYSIRGFAVYHGWLPLYSIAASLAAFGIEPDLLAAEPEVRHSSAEMLRLTRAARLPAVLFGLLFLLLLFAMADELYGRDAAWGALLAGAFSPEIVDFARQARYYALSMLLSAACCLMVWRVYRHGRSRDYVLGAIAFALLFHTHVVAFLIACAAMALVLPMAARRPGFRQRGLAFAAVVTTLTLPWALLTGFLEQAGRVPRAWPYLRFPDDLLAFLRLRGPAALLLIGGSLVFLAVHLAGRRMPASFTRPFLAYRAQFGFLIAWLALTYVVFTVATPAASYSLKRMMFPLLGPGIVLGASLVAALARAAAPNPPTGLAGLLLAAYLALFAGLDPLALERRGPRYNQEAIEFLRRHAITPDTRIYATPNFHLFLTVYTGLPVQSVAPVRKSFLDSYPGELLLVEVMPLRPPTADMVAKAAVAAGLRVEAEEEQKLAWLVTRHAMRKRLEGNVAGFEPPLEADSLPAYLRPLVETQPAYTKKLTRADRSVKDFPAMFRGFHIVDWSTWWNVYFYRFVNPEARMGPNANYSERIRTARASVLPSGATVYRCPALPRTRAVGAPAAP